MAVAALVVSIVAALIAAASAWYYRAQARTASAAVEHARTSAEAATRSADLAEVVERGRHYGWRIEARTNEIPMRAYTLRNVGTIDARNVTLAGQYTEPICKIELGVSGLIFAALTSGNWSGR